MLNKILATISILMLIGFVFFVVVSVMEPDLSIIIVGVVGMVIYDFWRSNTGKRKGRSSKKS